MKVYQFALGLLIFSAVATLFNEVGLFPVDVLHTGATVNQVDINQIMEIDSTGGTVETAPSIIDQVADIGGGLIFFAKVIWKSLLLALTIGSLVMDYFPGSVGVALGSMVYGITYFIYGWGGMQLFRKVSTKGMD